MTHRRILAPLAFLALAAAAAAAIVDALPAAKQ